jgi:hypothetical protein
MSRSRRCGQRKMAPPYSNWPAARGLAASQREFGLPRRRPRARAWLPVCFAQSTEPARDENRHCHFTLIVPVPRAGEHAWMRTKERRSTLLPGRSAASDMLAGQLSRVGRHSRRRLRRGTRLPDVGRPGSEAGLRQNPGPRGASQVSDANDARSPQGREAPGRRRALSQIASERPNLRGGAP